MIVEKNIFTQCQQFLHKTIFENFQRENGLNKRKNEFSAVSTPYTTTTIR